MASLPDDVTQKAVGKLFKVGQSAVTKWKTGKDTPSLPRARAMAAEFGVAVDWLLDGRGPKFPGKANDPMMAELLGIWDKLSPDSRVDLLKNARYIRTIQITSSAERVKEVHEKLQEANHKAKAGNDRRGAVRN
ncbi:MAG: helix-turn-helix transcriptional regulator [Steroidobacteraceae bacterium]